MMIELSGMQFFIIIVFVVMAPLLGFLFEYKLKKESNKSDNNSDPIKRKLVNSDIAKNEKDIFFRKIDWSILYSGWLKGKAINFESEKIPLICILNGIEKKGAWSQPIKIGANQLISSSKNYLEQFGKAVFTITSVSREDVARNVGWGLASYLNVVAGRILIFEINQRSPQKKISTRIEMGNRLFDDLPDPISSEIANVDVVTFDLAYTWPEDILTRELMEQFINHYRTVYNMIYIITPPIMYNGFARKASSCSDCCILIGHQKDDQALLIDSYQRIKNSVRENENDTLLVWGVMEKSG